MTLDLEQLKQWREELGGVTPGPWAVSPVRAQVDAFEPHPIPLFQMLWPTTLRTEQVTDQNAAHLAKCDPQTIAALIDGYVAMREALTAIVDDCLNVGSASYIKEPLLAAAMAALNPKEPASGLSPSRSGADG